MNLRGLTIIILVLSVILACITFITIPIAHSQNWIALPPYNTLWPLWSPLLSPIDPMSGLAIPLIDSLDHSTVLPVQPGLTWNPSLLYPWLLYNTPLGMVYFDAMFGINTWPPYSLFNTATNEPLLLSLPLGYADLPPTDPAWLNSTIPTGNSFYTKVYPYYAYLATLPLMQPFTLPTLTPLNFLQYLTLLPVPQIDPALIPAVVGANAILGL